MKFRLRVYPSDSLYVSVLLLFLIVSKNWWLLVLLVLFCLFCNKYDTRKLFCIVRITKCTIRPPTWPNMAKVVVHQRLHREWDGDDGGGAKVYKSKPVPCISRDKDYGTFSNHCTLLPLPSPAPFVVPRWCSQVENRLLLLHRCSGKL